MSEMRVWFLIVSTAAMMSAASTCAAETFHEVRCEGDYQHHLQGVCTSDDSIFWCFTSEFVKTDPRGKVLKKIPVPGHHGDLCYHDGKIDVAVNLGKFNRAPGDGIRPSRISNTMSHRRMWLGIPNKHVSHFLPGSF